MLFMQIINKSQDIHKKLIDDNNILGKIVTHIAHTSGITKVNQQHKVHK